MMAANLQLVDEPKLSLETILESDNIAKELSDQALSKIGKDVVDGFDVDRKSREGWESKIEDWTRLALQVAEMKTTPWPNAANVKYPLITNAALQFSSRAYPALLTGTNVVRGRVVGFDETGEKLDKAVRIGKHMSYQLLEEMDDWEEHMDKLLFALPIIGCMFKKTYHDSSKSKNVSEIVYPKELVVNYFASCLEDADRITHVLNMNENDIHERIERGIFLDETFEKPARKNEESATDAATGVISPETEDKTCPYELLEQCTFIDLDGDGYEEPYICTVDRVSGKVARIVARFNMESIQFNAKGNVIRIEPDHYYTKYSFIPSPDGSFYDIGFGILLGPINDTVNTLINQLLDAGTLSNMQSGFIARGIRIKGGSKAFTPGEWKYVNTAGDDLRKGIVPLPTKEPSNVLFSLLGMMVDAGEKLSSSTDMMQGEIPGQNTKATVAMASIDQGMKVFKSIYKRTHRSLAKEFKKLYKLNSLFLSEDAYFTVLDVGQEEAQKISRRDYDMGDVDVVPTSDPNVATEEQKMAKVQALFEVLQLGTVNPAVVTKRYLEATEQSNIQELMQMPEQGPSGEEQKMQLEQAQMQFDQAKFKDESHRAWEDLAIKRAAAEATALKNTADAEAAEIGQQMEEYKAELKNIQDDNIAQMKVRQMEEDHQRKLQQQEEAHRQKMIQQEEINRQKRAQERSKSVKLQRDAEGNISGATIEEKSTKNV